MRVSKALKVWHTASSFSPLRHIASYVLPVRHARPVFIIGCPRSGTTLLFRIFKQSPHLGSLGGEGERIWEHFHPLASKQWGSHALEESDVTEAERSYVYRRFYRAAGGKRFVEKTPRNCLRIPYLRRLFPDACFVYLKRDGCDTVGSLMREWRSPRHRPIPLPVELRIGGYGGTGWKFILPPGWQAYVSASLAEVCAFQWIASNREVLRAKEAIPPDQWSEVFYEDIIAAPVSAVRRLFEAVGVPFSRSVEEYCRTAVRRPEVRSGEDQAGEIAAVLPQMMPMMTLMGYRVEGGA